MMRFDPRRRGFTLTEMLIALILLSAFGLVSARLFTATFRLSYNTAEAQNAAASTDSALTALRSDVWSAKSIETPDARTAVLKTPDERTITWTIEGDDLLRREGESEERRAAAGRDVSFATDGVALVLRSSDPRIGELSMACEMNLLARLTQ